MIKKKNFLKRQSKTEMSDRETEKNEREHK